MQSVYSLTQTLEGKIEKWTLAEDILGAASTLLMVTLLKRGSLLSKRRISESLRCTSVLKLLLPVFFMILFRAVHSLQFACRLPQYHRLQF